jgi:hypothetical protein
MMILGFTKAIWAASHSQQAAISSFVGTRFPGGRHFTTFVMYTSSRGIPALSRILVRSWPAGPTKGRPCLIFDLAGGLADEHQFRGSTTFPKNGLASELGKRTTLAGKDTLTQILKRW